MGGGVHSRVYAGLFDFYFSGAAGRALGTADGVGAVADEERLRAGRADETRLAAG